MKSGRVDFMMVANRAKAPASISAVLVIGG